MGEIISRELRRADAAELSALLGCQRAEYIANFHPFSFDEPALREVLGLVQKDWFRAFESEGRIVGFFMLRGFDAGYTRPSYGVFVAEEFAGRGLGKRALFESIAWSREKGVKSIMLKVSSANERAARLYLGAGFVPFGTCPQTGHTMMELRLQD